MSRFGTTALFEWAEGDVLTSGNDNEIFLEVQDMFQFPFETSKISDKVSYRSKSGRRYEYENYNKNVHSITWTDLREVTRNSLFEMVHSLPILSLESDGNDFGEFRVVPDSWSDSETTHERYSVSFSIEEI